MNVCDDSCSDSFPLLNNVKKRGPILPTVYIDGHHRRHLWGGEGGNTPPPANFGGGNMSFSPPTNLDIVTIFSFT